jgi:hypothetical protein
MKGKTFYTTVFVLVILVGLLLAYQTYRLDKELRTCRKIIEYSGDPMMDVGHLNQVIENYLLKELEKSDAKWKLVIIYTPDDCPNCLEELSYWSNFTAKEKRFGCWGLVNHPDTNLAQKYYATMGWKFPTTFIDRSLFGDNFGLKKTPIKLLLNNENKIYYVEGPLPNWQRDGKLYKLLKELL